MLVNYAEIKARSIHGSGLTIHQQLARVFEMLLLFIVIVIYYLLFSYWNFTLPCHTQIQKIDQ